MNIAQIEDNLQELVTSFDKESFIYDLLRSYDLPKASITRLKKGSLNLSRNEGEISWKKKLFFKEEFEDDLHLTISRLNGELKHGQRFIIVTDYETLLAIDTKTDDRLDIPLSDLPKHYDFFLPWAGMEKAQHQNENPADVKAAVKMAKLFDEIKKDNPDDSPEFIHGLNVFLSRLLFCFFAEDTHIFEDNQFTNAIDSHTQPDGSDLNEYLDTLFEVLDTPENEREGLPEYLSGFPYVNGGLFEQKHSAPSFSSSSRKAIISSGDQDWSAINPDIFGSMFQAVISPDQRSELQQHYTSVPNIMKVLEPLFLNELNEAFEQAIGNPKKLNKLLIRLKSIKIFDPACGSGNFLIIAYKHLRKIEMKVLEELGNITFPEISLSQFYGIEMDDFAHEIAKLALWLSEHQMNVEFFRHFGRTNPTLPLSDAGNIIHGNACRMDWKNICPSNEDTEEIYLIGNPPYAGSREQSQAQKQDLKRVFESGYKSMDYISAWFFLGAQFIKGTKSRCAFVSTNSISQGEQVALVWPRILTDELQIGFAYKDFKWTNNAKQKAGVTVVIIGLDYNSNRQKAIYDGDLVKKVSQISPYISSGRTIYVRSRRKPISNFPEMCFGNMPADGGELLFSTNEMNEFISREPGSKKYFKELISTSEYLKGKQRWCLWLEGVLPSEIEQLQNVQKIVDEVRRIRLASSRPNLAAVPHLFAQITQPKGLDFVLIPRHSSENRNYIPIGLFDKTYVAHDSTLIVPNSELYLFSVLMSRIHMTWVKKICGRLESRFRYSKEIVYNNFPFPAISKKLKAELTQSALRIVDEREKHSDCSPAQLYGPETMPNGLREAHHVNDIAVERCYRTTPFKDESERLEYLFRLYEKMIQEEKEKDTLFATEKKKRKGKK